MKSVIVTLAILLAAQGLWMHDWREILAGIATAVIWPLISADIDLHDEETW